MRTTELRPGSDTALGEEQGRSCSDTPPQGSNNDESAWRAVKRHSPDARHDIVFNQPSRKRIKKDWWRGKHYADKPCSLVRTRPISPELRAFYRDEELLTWLTPWV